MLCPQGHRLMVSCVPLLASVILLCLEGSEFKLIAGIPCPGKRGRKFGLASPNKPFNLYIVTILQLIFALLNRVLA